MTPPGERLGLWRRLLHAHEAGDLQQAWLLAGQLPSEDAAAGHALLRRPPDEGAAADEPLILTAKGWDRYYQAAYTEAAAHFEQAHREGGPWRSSAALGLGKVSSDLGYWSVAVGWLRAAYREAYRSHDLYRMAEASGALGEVLVRAGHPVAALELFEQDAALLPPGSGFAPRLRNYRAVALARVGRADTAATWLWEAYFATRERGLQSPDEPVAAAAAVSACFSMCSLMWVSFRSGKEGLWQEAHKVWERDRPRLEPLALRCGAELPLAFMEVARAGWAVRGLVGSGPGEALGRAHQLLLPRHPVEACWVQGLGGEGGAAGWDNVLQRPPPPPYTGPAGGALDAWLDAMTWPEGCAFTALAAGVRWEGSTIFFL